MYIKIEKIAFYTLESELLVFVQIWLIGHRPKHIEFFI